MSLSFSGALSARPTSPSQVTITTWDGKPVTPTELEVSGGNVAVTVAESGNYIIHVKSDAFNQSYPVKFTDGPDYDPSDTRSYVDNRSSNSGGPRGPEGPRGPAGLDGLPGKDGTDGLPGTNGRDGSDGIDGIDGLPGGKGDKGDKGDKGEDGTNGTNGRDGIDGIDGFDGDQGEPGRPGIHVSPTPPTLASGVSILWIDTSNGNISLNLVTGD